MNDVFLRACRREPTPYTPIWLMRQAGRYQPEYREIRSKVSFVELCRTPDLAAEVTVLAANQLGVDAAIVFADILLILEPLGVPFEFGPGHGPKILSPLRTAADVDRLETSIDPNETLGFVMETIRKCRAELEVPLIGFAGAPFTLASYAIEGGGSKNYYETKKVLLGDPGLWDALMTRLVDGTIAYLNAQVAAGAQALQVFDSWVGCLTPVQYRERVFPHMKRLFDALDPSVPHIHFGTGNPTLYPMMQEAGGDVIGVDWRVDLGGAWDALGGESTAIMGNLDPAALLAPTDAMLAEADQVLASAGGRPGHVFNLGHGIMPEATVDGVRRLVDHVHEKSAR